ETFRTAYLGRESDLYDELVELLIERGDAAAALDVAEPRRESTLLDVVERSVLATPATASNVMRMLDDGDVLLEYAVLPHGLVRWELRRSGVTISRVPASPSELRGWTARLSATRSDRAAMTAPQRAALASLYRLLIPQR